MAYGRVFYTKESKPAKASSHRRAVPCFEFCYCDLEFV